MSSDSGVSFSRVEWENIAQLGIDVREGRESPLSNPDKVFKEITPHLDSVVKRSQLDEWWKTHGGDMLSILHAARDDILTDNEAFTSVLLPIFRIRIRIALVDLGFNSHNFLESNVSKSPSSKTIARIQYGASTTTLSGRMDGIFISFSKDNPPPDDFYENLPTVENVVRTVRHCDAKTSKTPPALLVYEKKRPGTSEDASHGGMAQVISEALTMMVLTARPLQPFLWTSGTKWRAGVLEINTPSTEEKKTAWIGPAVYAPFTRATQANDRAGFDEAAEKLFYILLFLTVAPPAKIRDIVWRLNSTSN